MKFTTITGGLGNQLFIYAFCEELRVRGEKAVLFVAYGSHSNKYGHQGYELEKLFAIRPYEGFFSIVGYHLVRTYSHLLRLFPVRQRKKLWQLVGIEVVTVPENFIFYPEIFDFQQKHQLFRGTWQSEHFFEKSKEKIREIFVFRESLLSEATIRLKNQIKQENSVSIHIRRGDYLSNQYANGFAGVCTSEYYHDAIAYIQTKVEKPIFYIFTDDPEWVRDHFHVENATYVQHNAGSDSWQDMYLMSQCKHNIIANSSFSWWGAWLNANQKKIVIAPKRWWNFFEQDDVVPAEWKRM